MILTATAGTASSPAGIDACGGPTCVASFAPNTAVTLTGAATAGTFVGFSGCDGPRRFGVPRTTCQFKVTGAMNVTATFHCCQACSIESPGCPPGGQICAC